MVVLLVLPLSVVLVVTLCVVIVDFRDVLYVVAC